jgi:hypothetical protein
MKKTGVIAVLNIILSVFSTSLLHAENTATPLWPNSADTGILTPGGWGASAGMVFVGAGTVTPQVYTNHSDGSVGAGFGLGNPEKNMGVELSVAMMDVDKMDNFSYGIKVHHIIADGTSIALGGINLFHDKNKSDADESFYVAISHAVQSLPSEYQPNQSKLHVSVGVGNGMFSRMSPDDIAAGKGKHGTRVFGSTAYEVFKATNIIVEWSGINMNSGISTGLLTFDENIPVTLTVAAGDMTHYSGDGVRLLCALSCAVSF